MGAAEKSAEEYVETRVLPKITDGPPDARPTPAETPPVLAVRLEQHEVTVPLTGVRAELQVMITNRSDFVDTYAPWRASHVRKPGSEVTRTLTVSATTGRRRADAVVTIRQGTSDVDEDAMVDLVTVPALLRIRDREIATAGADRQRSRWR